MSLAHRPKPRLRVVDVVLAPLTALERTRGRRRLVLIAVYLIIAAFLASLVWREWRLRGLPDVGDPFDVAAFEAAGQRPTPSDAPAFSRAATAMGAAQAAREQIDRDALDLYRAAVAALGNDEPLESRFGDYVHDWRRASPAVRAWLERNRRALSLYRRAVRQPVSAGFRPVQLDATFRTPATREAITALARLAALESSRRLALGDPDGSWACARDILRSSRDLILVMCANQQERLQANAVFYDAVFAIESWAIDPRVDAEALRRAIDETRPLIADIPTTSEILKINYLDSLRAIEDQPGNYRILPGEEAELPHWYLRTPPGRRIRWFYRHEPERSRRVLRLIYANRLAFEAIPPDERPSLVDPGVYDTGFATPVAPGAGALDPTALDDWYKTTLAARQLADGWDTRYNLDEDRSRLLVALAAERYRRDHGHGPWSAVALVPTYLDRLPVEFPPAFHFVEGPTVLIGLDAFLVHLEERATARRSLLGDDFDPALLLVPTGRGPDRPGSPPGR